MKINSPQQKRFHWSLLHIFVGGSFCFFLLLSIFTLLQQNGFFQNTSLENLKILSSDTAISILVAVGGVWLTLKGMAQNAMPYLVYDSLKVSSSILGLSKSKSGYWRIILRNAGAGVAIFESVSFICNGKDFNLNGFSKTLLSLKIGLDYQAMEISKGYALRPQSELTLIEIRISNLEILKDALIKLSFKDTFGSSYERKIAIYPKL